MPEGLLFVFNFLFDMHEQMAGEDMIKKVEDLHK